MGFDLTDGPPSTASRPAWNAFRLSSTNFAGTRLDDHLEPVVRCQLRRQSLVLDQRRERAEQDDIRRLDVAQSSAIFSPST